MIKLYLILLLATFGINTAASQEVIPIPSGGYVVRTIIINGDTVPFIPLREVIILPPREFKNKREEIRYTRLVRNLKKVLPYARIANNRLVFIENEIVKIEDPNQQKRFIKQQEQLLKDEFKDEITSLTITQGRLLIKLIDRETGRTSYDIIKELRGSFSAFLYQGIARIFGENLKDTYDAYGEDQLIEEILIRIQNGEL